MNQVRRAVLRCGDGMELVASAEEGWSCGDQQLEHLLNAGWPLRRRIRRPGDDVLETVAREVAKVFSARLVALDR